MKICKVLQTKEEIQHTICEHWFEHDDTKLPPLFHGTDSSLIGISKQDREQINYACEKIIFDIYALLKSEGISIIDKRLMNSRDSYSTSADAYAAAGGRVNNSPLYRYGDFYVTNDPQIAVGYSKEAWILGETGRVANRLVEGAEAVGIELPREDEFINAIKLFDERKSLKKNPVVLMITDCDSSEIYSLGGENIKKRDETDFLGFIHGLKELTSMYSYQLSRKTLEKDATFFMVEAKHYTELINAWREYENLNRRKR